MTAHRAAGAGPAAERAAALLAAARATPGFMPDREGVALHLLARRAARSGLGPVVEVGAYCGRSTLYLVSGVAACADAPRAARVYSVDHHRGSEEMQEGWPHHDPSLVDPATGRMDSLPRWRRAVESAGAEDLAVAVVGDSRAVASDWRRDASLVLLDGGHADEVAWADYRGWGPHVAPGGWLALHDVFPDPADGGRPPYECYRDALASGELVEEAAASRGSLRVLRRVAGRRAAAR